MPTSDEDRVWAMIADLDYCLLTTHHGDTLNSRPMSSIADQKARTLHFLSGADTPAVAELRADPRLALHYSNGSNKFLFVRARATISGDRALIAGLWNPGAQAFWPEGPDKSDVVAFVVDPESAEFWDGDNRLVSTIKFVTALATGTAPEMGNRGSVTL